MYWLTVVEIAGISIFSAYLIQNYCNDKVSYPVKALALMAWVMNFAIIGFVPLDIYITMRNAERGTDPQNDPAYVTLATLYQTLYWGLFVLCWTMIPLVTEYVSAVDFDPNDRIKRSLNANLRFYIMISILGLAFIVYILVTGQVDQYGLNTFLKSLANCYGVALIIGLLGYSLITIPKTHMRTAQFDVQLRYLYFRTATLFQEKKDAKHAFTEESKNIMMIKDSKFENAHFDTYVQLSLDVIPVKIQKSIEQQMKKRHSSFLQALQQPSKKQEVPKDIEEMMQIFQTLRRSSDNLNRIKAAIKQHLKQCYQMEDIIKFRNSSDKRVDFTFRKARTGSLAPYLDLAEWYWLCHYKPQFKIFISVMLGIMSFLVIIHEVTLFMDTGFTIFGLPLKLTDNLVMIQIFTFIPLLYITFCVYYGMFRIKISGFYGLYPDHQTDAASLFFTTTNFSRVSAPICINYLKIIRLKHQTAFNYSMGNIDLIPIFGISFTSIFPLLLIVLCLINYYDLYDRLMKFLGMKQFLFAENFSDRLIYEGRDHTKLAKEKWLVQWEKVNIDIKDIESQGSKKQGQQIQMRLLDDNQ